MIGVKTNDAIYLPDGLPPVKKDGDYKCSKCKQPFTPNDSIAIPLSGSMGAAYHAYGCPPIEVPKVSPEPPDTGANPKGPEPMAKPKRQQNPGKFD